MPLPTKPTVNGSQNAWGGQLNTYLDSVTPKVDGKYIKNSGGSVVEGVFEDDVAATAAVQAKADLTIVSKLTSRVIDARDYGADHTAADNLDAINSALTAAGNAVASDGGTARVVLGASAKTLLVKPSKASAKKLIVPSGVTLDLSDITLKVADDADAYDDLITGTGSTRNVRITGGCIDTNATGHVAANIGIGANNKAYAIRFITAMTNLVVDGVTFLCCGINTVVVSGADCHDITIEGNSFTFQQGAAVTPDYDNSAVYVVADQIRVANNTWNAAIAEEGRACCELHGPAAVMTGNTSKGFETLVNLVTPDFVYPGSRNHIAVTGNSIIDGNAAVTLWPVTGDTLRGVVVSGNTIHLAQIDHNENATWGIMRSRAAGITGDIEGYIVSGNIISFQPGDTRSVDQASLALNYASMAGIGLGGGGQTRHARIEGNVILNAPQYGIRAGVSGSGSLSDVNVSDNTIVDAGQDASLPARFALSFQGVAAYTTIRDNRIHDTGTPTNKGQYAYQEGLTTGSTGNVVTRNRQTTVSGTVLSTSLSASDTYTAYYTKRATIDPANITAGGGQTLNNVTVQGAAPGDAAIATPVGAVETGIVWNAYVSAANTVTLRLINTTTADINPASRSWDIRVIPREFAVT